MAKDLLKFVLEDGAEVWVEEADDDRSGMTRVGRGGEDEDKTPRRFSDAIGRIKPAAEAVLNSLRGMNTPNEIALEFGVKFGGKAGAFLASVDSEATFKVSLKWSNKPEK